MDVKDVKNFTAYINDQISFKWTEREITRHIRHIIELFIIIVQKAF